LLSFHSFAPFILGFGGDDCPVSDFHYARGFALFQQLVKEALANVIVLAKFRNGFCGGVLGHVLYLHKVVYLYGERCMKFKVCHVNEGV
tara:strand:+ start:4131 stop:4397 length:267 start_codon:yes stop_codon:yes gene_type:complete